MQELIQTLKEMQESLDPYGLHEAIEMAESLLEKEKEQIIDAYEVSHISMMTAEQYYNETFNTKEK